MEVLQKQFPFRISPALDLKWCVNISTCKHFLNAMSLVAHTFLCPLSPFTCNLADKNYKEKKKRWNHTFGRPYTRFLFCWGHCILWLDGNALSRSYGPITRLVCQSDGWLDSCLWQNYVASGMGKIKSCYKSRLHQAVPTLHGGDTWHWVCSQWRGLFK